MASPSASARHLFVLAALVVAAVAAAPRSADAWGGAGGRFFFSRTTRAEPTAVEPGNAAAVPHNADAARPSTTAGASGRGYGLYGRPEENYPPDYFRRGVHRNAEKLTTTAAATTDVPAATVQQGAGGGGERGRTFPEDGSGRGRPPTDAVPVTATTGAAEGGEEAAPVGGGELEGVRPYPEDGSGRGRPPWYYTAFHRGGQQEQQEEQERREYGMSDTRVYQNGRYYYDVDAGRYGYGRESNPMRTTRPGPDEEEQFGSGSGYGRPRGAGGRRGGGGYGDAAGYRRQQRYGGSDEGFGNGAVEQSTNGFQEEEAPGQNGRYTP